MTTFLSQLDWRHAARAFDTKKPVSEADLKKVLLAIRMAPTSFGLQPFRVVVVSDPVMKEKIRGIGWNQPQYSTAAYVLAFVARTDLDARIPGLIHLQSGGDEARKVPLAGYEKMMRGYFSKLNPEQIRAWADKQAYIALGFAMAACAELKLDSCPMEGFSPSELDKLLQLPSGEYSSVMLTVGYRDPAQPVRAKIRFSEDDLFSFV